jgi:hypothetical protein
MSARDRLVLFGLACVAVLAAAWMLAVSPARKQASAASAEVESARTQLVHVQGEAAEARNVQQRYHKAYASLVSLGMAVPTSQEIPALMYALDHAANHHRVEFSSITNGAGSSGSSSRSPSSASSSSASGAGSSFSQMPFTFVFSGSYDDLIRLLKNLEGFTMQTTGGSLHVNGRLLTIQSIQLGGGGSSGGSSSGPAAAQGSSQMAWTITASAYTLAPSSSETSPGSGGAAGGATPTSSPGGSSGSSAVATPAVVRAGG